MIDIVLLTDNNYAIPTILTITSIITNKAPETCLNINILVNGVSEDNIQLFKELCSEKVQINIINAADKISLFEKFVTGTHVTYTAFLKFYIPLIFNDMDKILKS